MSFPDNDRIQLVKAQILAKKEKKMRISLRANGKEYTYAQIQNPKGRLELWLVCHRS